MNKKIIMLIIISVMLNISACDNKKTVLDVNQVEEKMPLSESGNSISENDTIPKTDENIVIFANKIFMSDKIYSEQKVYDISGNIIMAEKEYLNNLDIDDFIETDIEGFKAIAKDKYIYYTKNNKDWNRLTVSGPNVSQTNINFIFNPETIETTFMTNDKCLGTIEDDNDNKYSFECNFINKYIKITNVLPDNIIQNKDGKREVTIFDLSDKDNSIKCDIPNEYKEVDFDTYYDDFWEAMDKTNIDLGY